MRWGSTSCTYTEYGGYCMVERSGMGDFGAARLQDHGVPVGSETLGVSSRVRRAALSLQTQPEAPVVAGRAPTKTVTLTMLPPPCEAAPVRSG